VSEVAKEQDVLERVWKPKRVLAAWRQVKKNAGAAGIDQMSVDEFAERKTELLRGAIAKLRDGTYRFKPARRVLIRGSPRPRGGAEHPHGAGGDLRPGVQREQLRFPQG
jgi:retron-type reverse transcriptase